MAVKIRRLLIALSASAAGMLVLRAGNTLQLQATDGDEPIWQQVALEGEYRGHPRGHFKLGKKLFEEVITNFHAHPSYQGGKTDVIPWDFHHANEAPAASVAVAGAPAQGWVQELEMRKGPGGLELWALTRWLEQARQYVKSGQYKWASIAIWPDSKDGKTGKSIGTYLSSIALTNDPFIQGMQPLAASARGTAPSSQSANFHRPKGIHMSLAVRLATLLGIAPTVIMAAREDDAVACASLDSEVLRLADQRLQQCAMMAQQLSQMLQSMGVPEQQPGSGVAPQGVIASRIAALIKAEVDLEKLQPTLVALEKANKDAEDAAADAAVDQAIATYQLDARQRSSMLYHRKSDKAGFEKDYPPAAPPAPATHPHLLQSITSQPGQNALDRVSMRGGRLALAPERANAGPAPVAGPAAFGGQAAQMPQQLASQVAEIQLAPGGNSTQKAMAFLKAKTPTLSYNELHGGACDLLANLRSQGAQI